MEKIKRYSLILMLVLAGCNSPDSPDCLKSAGSIETITRPLPNIKSITLDDYVDVRIIQDSLNFVEITAGANLLDKIETEIAGLELRISNANTCNWVRRYGQRLEVVVHLSRLQKLVLNDGSGNVIVHPLTGDSLLIETNHASGDLRMDLQYRVLALQFHTGTCSAEIRGEVERLEMYSDSYGLLDAGELKSELAFVNNSSINDFYVWTEDYLYAAVNGRGNVYVKGHPLETVIEDNAEGEVIFQP